MRVMRCVAVSVAASLATATVDFPNAATAAAVADMIQQLPGAGLLPSRQFSGYLKGAKGDRLHYWLVESENDPKTDPVALWLNGGPGASSLMGFLTEMGPYVIARDNGIHYNPYNWAKSASVLFLEGPAGVGFSYCAGNASKTCWADDDTTSVSNLHALRDFFARFPHLGQQQGFMIWGESYAGVYVPTLARLVANAVPQLPIRFLGFSLGNPCTSNRYQGKDSISFDPDYALSAGLIDDTLHAELTSSTCAPPKTGRIRCRSSWRLYDILTSGLAAPVSPLMPGLGDGTGFLDMYDTGAYIGSMHPYWDAVGSYLNRADVRQALHMHEVDKWSLFASRLEYHKQYEACHDADAHPARQYNMSMLPIYRELVEKGYSVLLYSGDEDPSVQWRSSAACVRGVGFPEAAARGWRPWFCTEPPVSIELLERKSREWGPQLSLAESRAGPILGGYVVEFDGAGSGVKEGNGGTLTFATVRGVGHMVPQFRPQAAFHLFNRTMQAAVGRTGAPPDLSPPLSHDFLARWNDTDFYGDGVSRVGAVGHWLMEAQVLAATTDCVSMTEHPEEGIISISFGASICAGLFALASLVTVVLARRRHGDISLQAPLL